MNSSETTETMREALVTYTTEVNGRVLIIEHVPARVCIETGEQFFSPATVERIHQIVRGHQRPARTEAIPVYDFAA